jgi:hypothetical protein
MLGCVLKYVFCVQAHGMKENGLSNDDNSGHVVPDRLLTSSEVSLNIEVSFQVLPMLNDCLLHIINSLQTSNFLTDLKSC